MSRLPTWARSEAARDLLSAIIAEQPETTVGDAMGFRVEEYAGYNAASLRRIYRAWLDARLIELAEPTDVEVYEARRAALVATPDADELIRRLIAAPSILDLEPRSLGDGRHRVAA